MSMPSQVLSTPLGLQSSVIQALQWKEKTGIPHKSFTSTLTIMSKLYFWPLILILNSIWDNFYTFSENSQDFNLGRWLGEHANKMNSYHLNYDPVCAFASLPFQCLSKNNDTRITLLSAPSHSAVHCSWVQQQWLHSINFHCEACKLKKLRKFNFYLECIILEQVQATSLKCRAEEKDKHKFIYNIRFFSSVSKNTKTSAQFVCF